MDFKQIQDLIKAVNKSNIGELSIKDGDFEITIKQAQTTETQFVAVQAPMQMPPLQHAPQAPALPSAAPQQQAAPAPQVEAQPQEAANDDNLVTVKSPMIGTFYRSPKPGEPPFVNVGDKITKGQHICIIEAMKLFNEIESEVDGTIVKVLADDASPVEYDQPLFQVKPA